MPVVGVGHQGASRGCKGASGVTSEKSRQSIAKYSWELKMVYWTLKTIEHELRSMGPTCIPLLATRCLLLGAEGWWGRSTSEKKQPDPQADEMSCWPTVVPLLITRCLYLGWGIKGTCGDHVTYEKWRWSSAKYSWKLKMVWTLQTIEHEFRSMGPTLAPLLATRCLYWGISLTKGQSDPKAHKMSSWPDVVLLLATRCLYWGYVWAQVNWTQLSTALSH